MAIFLDTSALIPVFDGGHEHHHDSLRLFQSLDSGSGAYCSLHTLAEFFSVTTRMPGPGRLTPAESLFNLDQILRRVRSVSLDETDSLQTLAAVAAIPLTGAIIYDALLLQCARKVNAETVYTWNVRHFQRLAPELAGRIRTP